MKFKIICSGDEKGIIETISWYNNTYGTDFRVVHVIRDEVAFAEIEVSKYTESDVFKLGFQYGASVTRTE